MNKAPIIFETVISKKTDGESLKNYIIRVLEDEISGSKQFKKRLKSKSILVNGQTPPWNYLLKKGDTLTVLEIQKTRPNIDLKIEVIYEDKDCAIVFKPGGILVSGNAKRTIENALPNVIKTNADEGELKFPLAAHRLDYGTCGLLLIAKTASFLRSAKKAFEEHLIEKEYHAIVVGKVQGKTFTIDDNIDGKSAISHIELLQVVPSIHFGFLSFLKIKIETGRRHQIRKHLSKFGFPVLGDQDYALPTQRLRGKGLFLCSTRLHFSITKPVDVEIDCPPKFLKTLERQIAMYQKKSGDNTTL